MAIVFFVGATFVGFSLGFAANALVSALMIASEEKRRLRQEVILPTDLLPATRLTLSLQPRFGRPEFNSP